MSEKILIVEDDERIAHWVEVYLKKSGYQTRVEYDGQAGIEAASSWQPELVVLDLMLPGIGGLDVCQALRKISDVPVIMLTAKDTTKDRVAGLRQGADDYVTKPFDPEELVARIEAVLRRTNDLIQPLLEVPPYSLNRLEETVRVNGHFISLPHTHFKILEVFMRHVHQVLSREQIILLAFNKDFDSYDRAIDNHIFRLRKRISYSGYNPIKTVYGAGYKFVPEGQSSGNGSQ